MSTDTGGPARHIEPVSDRDDAPALGVQRLLQPLGDRRKDGDERNPGALAGGVFQGEVLDVDAGGADVGEKPTELAGGVGHEDLDLGVAARRPTVLSGDTGPSGISPGHDVGDRFFSTRRTYAS